jgi:K+-sensing histidine kinase KdpD
VSDREHAVEDSAGAASTNKPSASDERGSFLGFVAHEMRNPLSTALWSAELLVRLSPDERGGARGEKLSGMCLRALQRLRYLVEDHFLAERLDVGGIPLRPETVSLREAIESVVARMGLGECTVRVEEDLAITTDRGMLERALDAMLAVASSGKTPVRLQASRAGDTALVRVHGAAPASEALRPPQKGTASDPTGRALALYMAVRVAETLGGSLAAAADDYLLALPVAGPNRSSDPA